MDRASEEDSASLAPVASRRGQRTSHYPHKMTALAGLRLCNPDAWKKTILDALDQSQNDAEAAAKVLGISRSQMFRILQQPEFEGRPKRRRGPTGPRKKDHA